MRAELPSRLFVNVKAVTEPNEAAKELSTLFAGIGGITSNFVIILDSICYLLFINLFTIIIKFSNSSW